MATTSPDNIWTPDAGDAYALTTDLAATADTVQDAISALRTEAVTNANALRGVYSAIPTPGVEGRTFFATDTNRLWFDDGAAWISWDNGLFLVRPGSVSGTGATLRADGAVGLVSTAGTVSLVDCFTPRFDHYLVDIEIDAAAADAGGIFALRTAGGAISTGYYGTYTEQAIGVGPTKSEISNGSTFPAGRYSTNGGGIQIELFRTTKTVGSKQFTVRSQDGATYHRIGGGYVLTSAALTGVDIAFPTSVSAGRIKIYGYA